MSAGILFSSRAASNPLFAKRRVQLSHRICYAGLGIAAAGLMCARIVSLRSEETHKFGSMTSQEVIGRSLPIVRRLIPGTQAFNLAALPVSAYQGPFGRRTWHVQISENSRNWYAPDVTMWWNADLGQLFGILYSPHHRQQVKLSAIDAKANSRRMMIDTGISKQSPTWRLDGDPVKYSLGWDVHWRGNDREAKYHVDNSLNESIIVRILRPETLTAQRTAPP